MKFMIMIFLTTILLADEIESDYDGVFYLHYSDSDTGEEYEDNLLFYYFGLSDTYSVEISSDRSHYIQSEDGIESNEMVFTYDFTAVLSINVYGMEDGILSGITVTPDGEVTFKSSDGRQCYLELTPPDPELEGMYLIEGEGRSDYRSISYSDSITLETDGMLWEVNAIRHYPPPSSPDGSPVYAGFGFMIDDVLVLKYFEYLKVYEVTEDGLEGTWMSSFWDTEQNCRTLATGWEVASRLP